MNELIEYHFTFKITGYLDYILAENEQDAIKKIKEKLREGIYDSDLRRNAFIVNLRSGDLND